MESLRLGVQAKLLLVLSDGKVTVVGSNEEIPFDVRIIAATKDKLRDNDNFRQDLFFRLQVTELRVPALRYREQDIVTLFEYYAKAQCEQFSLKFQPARLQTRDAILSYPWPGNVRELINVATRYAINNCNNVHSAIEQEEPQFETSMSQSLKQKVEAYEQQVMHDKLSEHKGVVVNVLEDLKIERRTFNQKMVKYQMRACEFKET